MWKKIILLITISMFLTGCQFTNSDQVKQPKNMDNKKILMVIAPQEFRDEEFNDPHTLFKKEGIEADVASIQKGTTKGVAGTEVEIDLIASEVKTEDYAAVAFIGGPGMSKITGDDTLQLLAKRFYDSGKLTTAICIAPLVLGKAGILKNKKATVFPDGKDDLISSGAQYTEEDVVVDGNIITANGPGAATKFAQMIIKNLGN